MSLDLNYQSLGVKTTGSSTTVPDNNLAKLMYYLDCVFAVILSDDDTDRYTDYHNYDLLSAEEEQVVLGLVALFNPKIMIKLGLFIIDSRFLLSNKDNEFFEITDSRLGIHVNSEVMIGGVYRKVKNVMFCNNYWINQY